MKNTTNWLAGGVAAALAIAAVVGASGDAEAMKKKPKSITKTPVTIQNVTLEKGSLGCSDSGVSFAVTLVGNSKLAASGKISAVRYSNKNEVVSADYSLAAGETKTISVSMPFKMSCRDMAPPRFSVSLQPAAGGWDNNYKDLLPASVSYKDVAGNVYTGVSAPDPAKANNTTIYMTQVNYGLSAACGASNLNFTVAFKANTTVASAGTAQLTRRQEGAANTTITTAYSSTAGGVTKVGLASSWMLNCNEKVPQFDSMLVPTTGGSDDGYHSLMPSAITYQTKTGSTEAAPL